MMTQIYCGVDACKARLDAYVATHSAGGVSESFENNAEGIERLRLFAICHGAGMVVMESSGSVERLGYSLLWQAGMPCVLINPRLVYHYGQSLGFLEKTDRLDARIIARFAGARGLVAVPPPSHAQQRLTALCARLRQVTSDIITQKQRLHTAWEDFARDGIRDILKLLKAQSDKLSAEIASMIDDDPLWQALATEFTAYKGLASRTVAVLMADLREIGTLSNRAISKLAGLAPLADDSGKRQGRRSIRGGRASVRNILFLIGGHLARFEPDFAAFKHRLQEKGKAKMQIRIALAHKLLVRLNAKARDIRAKHVSTA
ncbi:MAG: IS110 family transposase [Asticcacaulis sp.]